MHCSPVPSAHSIIMVTAIIISYYERHSLRSFVRSLIFSAVVRTHLFSLVQCAALGCFFCFCFAVEPGSYTRFNVCVAGFVLFISDLPMHGMDGMEKLPPVCARAQQQQSCSRRYVFDSSFCSSWQVIWLHAQAHIVHRRELPSLAFPFIINALNSMQNINIMAGPSDTHIHLARATIHFPLRRVKSRLSTDRLKD